MALPRRTKIVTLEEPKLTAAASDPETATPPALPLAPPRPPVGTKLICLVRVLTTASELLALLVAVRNSGSWLRPCLACDCNSSAPKAVTDIAHISGKIASMLPARFRLIDIRLSFGVGD